MSYILEALKKSDQQRQRGATPTLQFAQLTVAAPKRPLLAYYSLLAAALLVAGIMIVWLHPWQAEQSASAPTLPGTEPFAAESPVPIPQQVSQEQNSTPAAQAVPVAGAMMKPGSTAHANSAAPGAAEPVPVKSSGFASDAQEQEAITFDALPPAIQQEIPAMTVQLHAYSSIPGERIVSINSIRLREGESLMVGLKLEQITPDGMIFSYKDYRFRRGIR